MTLVDTSVWVDHLRAGNSALKKLLMDGFVLTHPFVIGEIACGNLRNRKVLLRWLDELPSVVTAEHAEVVRLVEDRRLWGKGIGWIDAHLLASALIAGCWLWTLDQPLRAAAESLKVHAVGSGRQGSQAPYGPPID